MTARSSHLYRVVQRLLIDLEPNARTHNRACLHARMQALALSFELLDNLENYIRLNTSSLAGTRRSLAAAGLAAGSRLGGQEGGANADGHDGDPISDPNASWHRHGRQLADEATSSTAQRLLVKLLALFNGTTGTLPSLQTYLLDVFVVNCATLKVCVGRSAGPVARMVSGETGRQRSPSVAHTPAPLLFSLFSCHHVWTIQVTTAGHQGLTRHVLACRYACRVHPSPLPLLRLALVVPLLAPS